MMMIVDLIKIWKHEQSKTFGKGGSRVFTVCLESNLVSNELRKNKTTTTTTTTTTK
jgi:hypothetical protein